MPEQLIEIAQRQRTAAVRSSSIDEATRTVELTFSTGAQVERFSFFDGPFSEELAISREAIRWDRLRSGAPLLDAHNGHSLDATIGVVESADIRDGKAVATVRFAEGDERADKVWKKVAQGILRNVSVGYRVHEFLERKEGDRRILRATDWEPLEISIVPIPADPSAQVRGSNSDDVAPCVLRTLDPEEDETMPKEDEAQPIASTEEVRVDPPKEQPTPPEARSELDVAAIEKDAYERGRREALDIVSTAVIGGKAPRDLIRLLAVDMTPDKARAEMVKARVEAVPEQDEIDTASPLPSDERSEVIAKINPIDLYKKRNASMGSAA